MGEYSMRAIGTSFSALYYDIQAGSGLRVYVQ